MILDKSVLVLICKVFLLQKTETQMVFLCKKSWFVRSGKWVGFLYEKWQIVDGIIVIVSGGKKFGGDC